MKPLSRSLLHLLLTALLTLAFVPNVCAQKRVGVIMSGDIPFYGAIHEIFVSELNRRFAGAEDIEVILQRPFPNPISWSNAARKLIAFDVDLIVTYGAPATEAVIHEKSDIPQVYAGFYEPGESTVKSNYVTGCGFKVPLSSFLRYFKRLKTINTLGIVFNSLEEDSFLQYQTMRSLADQQNIKTEKIDIRSKEDLGKLETVKSDGVFITGSSLIHLWLDDIVMSFEQKQIPVADIFPDDTESGVLMTLYPPTNSQGEMAAEMVSKILLGAKPADISSIIFRETELVFNLFEARHLGIEFPIQLLIEATRVIE
ncbi:MAG: ABC transporter substrate-binding protein [Desulfobulbales bacterium]